jgi:hypothetical protein
MHMKSAQLDIVLVDNKTGYWDGPIGRLNSTVASAAASNAPIYNWCILQFLMKI